MPFLEVENVDFEVVLALQKRLEEIVSKVPSTLNLISMKQISQTTR